MSFERRVVTLLEIDIDSCANTYGVAPCTAAGAPGSECYNCWATCQDKANFTRTTRTRRFCTAGSPVPAGQSIRPYLGPVSTAPTKINIESGLAARASVTAVLDDEPSSDIGEDPYHATRAAPAGGKWLARLIARNPNMAGRVARLRRARFTAGWNDAQFIDENYIIDRVDPPDSSGRARMVFKDPTKLADRRQIPEPSAGRLATDITAGAVSLALETGEGADYPAAGHVRVGDEVIEYSANAADVLSGLTRGSFNTVAESHSAGDGVQLCRVWINTPVWQVLRDLWLESGMPPAWIDAAGFQAQDAAWLGQGYYVTACLSDPEKASKLVSELAVQVGGFTWWDPVAQLVRFKVLAPLAPGESVAATLTDDNAIIEGSVKIKVLEGLRETLHSIRYAPRSATAPDDENAGYLRGQIYIDPNAESVNDLGERRSKQVFSRWFSTANDSGMATVASHRIGYYHDAPRDIELAVGSDHEAVQVGVLVDVTTAGLTGFDGAPLTTRAIVTMRDDEETRINLVLRTTQFGFRYAFIAPDGAADYPGDDDEFVHICQDDGTFADGSSGYQPF